MEFHFLRMWVWGGPVGGSMENKKPTKLFKPGGENIKETTNILFCRGI